MSLARLSPGFGVCSPTGGRNPQPLQNSAKAAVDTRKEAARAAGGSGRWSRVKSLLALLPAKLKAAPEVLDAPSEAYTGTREKRGPMLEADRSTTPSVTITLPALLSRSSTQEEVTMPNKTPLQNLITVPPRLVVDVEAKPEAFMVSGYVHYPETELATWLLHFLAQKPGNIFSGSQLLECFDNTPRMRACHFVHWAKDVNELAECELISCSFGYFVLNLKSEDILLKWPRFVAWNPAEFWPEAWERRQRLIRN